jgi:hypothetical protein
MTLAEHHVSFMFFIHHGEYYLQVEDTTVSCPLSPRLVSIPTPAFMEDAIRPSCYRRVGNIFALW